MVPGCEGLPVGNLKQFSIVKQSYWVATLCLRQFFIHPEGQNDTATFSSSGLLQRWCHSWKRQGTLVGCEMTSSTLWCWYSLCCPSRAGSWLGTLQHSVAWHGDTDGQALLWPNCIKNQARFAPRQPWLNTAKQLITFQICPWVSGLKVLLFGLL